MEILIRWQNKLRFHNMKLTSYCFVYNDVNFCVLLFSHNPSCVPKRTNAFGNQSNAEEMSLSYRAQGFYLVFTSLEAGRLRASASSAPLEGARLAWTNGRPAWNWIQPIRARGAEPALESAAIYPPISRFRLAARRRGQGSSNREKYSKKKIRRNLSLKPVGTPVRLGFNRARKIGGKLTAPVKDRTGATIKIGGRRSVEDLFSW